MTTYAKAKKFIDDAKQPKGFYQGIRDILASDEWRYPEDHQIKELQRLADAKYEKLTSEKRTSEV